MFGWGLIYVGASLESIVLFLYFFVFLGVSVLIFVWGESTNTAQHSTCM